MGQFLRKGWVFAIKQLSFALGLCITTEPHPQLTHKVSFHLNTILIGNQKSKHYISLVTLPHNNLQAILELDLYGLYHMQTWIHKTFLKNIHPFVLLYFQEAWTQHMQHPGEEEMFFFASQIISLWKKRYMRGEQVLLLCVLGINSWWRMSRN